MTFSDPTPTEDKMHHHRNRKRNEGYTSSTKNDKVNAFNVNGIDLEIQDIEGIGPTTAKKLKEAGIESVMDLAAKSAEQLALELECHKDTAADLKRLYSALQINKGIVSRHDIDPPPNENSTTLHELSNGQKKTRW
jgi:hypothetical protein